MSATAESTESAADLPAEDPHPTSSPPIAQQQASPAAVPAAASEDVDMATSLTLPPPGQNHDRQDNVPVEMAIDTVDTEEGPPTIEVIEPSAGHGTSNDSNTAVEEPSETAPAQAGDARDDAMDTTPDPPLITDAVQWEFQAGTSPVPNEGGPASPMINPTSPAGQTPDEVRERDPEMSSDSDENENTWQEIVEDTGVPDEVELKEIEETEEHSALDTAYWEGRAFAELADPEYRPVTSGQIQWSIPNYNGTKTSPNKEPIMRSPIVRIGDYDWRIKFFPKGNGSENLSIYIECVSLAKADDEETEQKSPSSSKSTDEPEKTSTEPTEASTEQSETIKAALPLLDPKPKPRGTSLAAQISLVLYNPAEPRVSICKTSQHRYCAENSDWGWSRYYPYYDIQVRHRGQRQALLRNDSLAMTAYIRIVSDDTGCLWDHDNESNPWNSFSMTGLRALECPTDQIYSCGTSGNLVALTAVLMLLKPVRRLLYDPKSYSNTRPTRMMAALRDTLLDLRMGADLHRPLVLARIASAFRWYGISEDFAEFDLIELWDIIRAKLDFELQQTRHANRLNELFGARRSLSASTPSYRVPVTKGDTMQQAIDASSDFLEPSQALPRVLQIEMKRREFDETTRTWERRLNKVSLDQKVSVRGVSYTLFGFITHTSETSQYNSIVRPNGPGTKWYKYVHGREEPQHNPINRVICLTEREAINEHEGREKGMFSEPVAYIATYIRDDEASDAFNDVEPAWAYGEEQFQSQMKTTAANGDAVSIEEAKPVAEQLSKADDITEFRIVDSRMLLNQEGPGFLNLYDIALTTSRWVYKCALPTSASNSEIQKRIAKVVRGGVKDSRQIKFWAIDSTRGADFRPHLMSIGDSETSPRMDGTAKVPKSIAELLSEGFAKTSGEYWLWAHIVPVADVPALPQPMKTNDSAQINDDDGDEGSSNRSQVLRPPPEIVRHLSIPPAGEDTVMSEADDESVDGNTNGDNQSGSSGAASRRNSNHAQSTPLVATNTADTQMEGAEDALTLFPLGTDDEYPPKLRDDGYFILKVFDHQKQTLKFKGSFAEPRNARIDHIIMKILKVGKNQVTLYEELSNAIAYPIRKRKKLFEDSLSGPNKPQESLIIIAHVSPPSEPVAAELAARGAFADVSKYLKHRSLVRNFPDLADGHVTLDYFSHEHYTGHVKGGIAHGAGTKIYNDGSAYAGAFEFGKRHGAGKMTYPDGNTYEGDWVHNQQEGQGTYVNAESGNSYTGGWKQDKRFGAGVTTWKQAQEVERMCRICWDEDANAALNDCGHVVACINCARRVDTCPVCRRRVLSAIKLFYV